jgi:hypothetical protein
VLLASQQGIRMLTACVCRYVIHMETEADEELEAEERYANLNASLSKSLLSSSSSSAEDGDDFGVEGGGGSASMSSASMDSNGGVKDPFAAPRGTAEQHKPSTAITSYFDHDTSPKRVITDARFVTATALEIIMNLSQRFESDVAVQLIASGTFPVLFQWLKLSESQEFDLISTHDDTTAAAAAATTSTTGGRGGGRKRKGDLDVKTARLARRLRIAECQNYILQIIGIACSTSVSVCDAVVSLGGFVSWLGASGASHTASLLSLFSSNSSGGSGGGSASSNSGSWIKEEVLKSLLTSVELHIVS